MNFDLLNGAAPLALPVATDVLLVGFLACALINPCPDDQGDRWSSSSRAPSFQAAYCSLSTC